jgi:hypothetical protein
MYRQSMFVLENDFDPKHQQIKIALIDEGGGTRWDSDF